MKKILLILLLCLPLAVTAKETKDKTDPKYLEGAITLVDDKIVFNQTLNAPSLTQKELYDLFLNWANERFKPSEEKLTQNKVVYTDPEKGEIAAVAEEYIVFSSTALSLDRTRIYYQLYITVTDGKCDMSMSRIRYWYDEYRDGGQRYSAEEWITDEMALNKKKTKLAPICGKFRRGTIDLKDKLFEEAANVLGVSGTQAQNTTSVQPVQPKPAETMPGSSGELRTATVQELPANLNELASAGRICDVLDEKVVMKESENPLKEVPSSSVEFRNVSFSYSSKAKERTLEDISLSIAPGSVVGILGGTGSGKSSLVQLIDRLYDVDSGHVLVGGNDVRAYSLSTLRDAVGMVLQKNLLFSGTIRDNLRWGDSSASDGEMMEACDRAGAGEFIRRMPKGLDTDLGQGGVNVSGGQKQRLCIARALLKKPKILIFDDSTSAVDSATEKLIRDNLRKLEGVTKIFIAQRISTVIEADCIFILEGGRLAASGTHDELMKTSGIYREIHDSQMKGGSL